MRLFSAMLALSLCACASPEGADGPRTFVATLAGTDAVVAVVVDGDTVLAYTCGGPTMLATHTRWFQGTLASGAVAAFELERDGWILSGSLAGSTIEGALAPAQGEPSPFVADEALPDSLAGLYWDERSECATGLVVLPDEGDGAPAARGAYCDPAGKLGQVTPLQPIRYTPNGVAVLLGVAPDAAPVYLRAARPKP